MWRLKIATANDAESINNKNISTNNLPFSIFWLLPQHALIGVCEVFLSAGQMEFFVDQAPKSMRSLGNALFISTMGLGNFISGILITIVTKVTWDVNGGWIGNDLNQSHMDYFYWLLAGLTVINFIAFLFCGHVYTYKGSNINVDDGSKFISLASEVSPSSNEASTILTDSESSQSSDHGSSTANDPSSSVHEDWSLQHSLQILISKVLQHR